MDEVIYFVNIITTLLTYMTSLHLLNFITTVSTDDVNLFGKRHCNSVDIYMTSLHLLNFIITASTDDVNLFGKFITTLLTYMTSIHLLNFITTV